MDSKVKTDGEPFQFWPIPSGKAMSIYWSNGRIYYVVLGEDKLKNPQCQGCARISNMEFGWKRQQNVQLFVCTNIEEIKPRICEPIEWDGRLAAEANCPYYEKAKSPPAPPVSLDVDTRACAFYNKDYFVKLWGTAK